jgi:hypothetical protein
LELLWIYINIRIGPKLTNITIGIHIKEILKIDKFERGGWLTNVPWSFDFPLFKV